MFILKFLLLAIRPASKLEATFGWWDVLNAAILLAYPIMPKLLPIAEWLKEAPLVWFAGIPALLLFIAGIKLQSKLDRLKTTKPRIAITPRVYGNQAFLEVHNSGAFGLFRATSRMIADSCSSQLYVAYWEGLGNSCPIDKGGQGAIKVAEKTKTDRGDGNREDIRKGGLVGLKMGTSGEQIFAVNTWKSWQEGNKTKSVQEEKGIMEITITSEPEPRDAIKPFRYLVALGTNGISLTELPIDGKEDSPKR